MNYNTYINKLYSINRANMDENNYILPKDEDNNNHHSSNILNDIVQHPFINTLSTNIDSFSLKDNDIQACNIILYRIRHYNDYHYVEYYVPYNTQNKCREIVKYNNYSYSDCLVKYVNDHIDHIGGRKRLKGYILYNNELFGIVQVRDTNINTNTNHWITLWDIIAYKQVFREKIQNNIIYFFMEYNRLSALYINNHQCIMPMILYCNIPTTYSEYIQNTGSIQYCQRENGPLIILNNNYTSEYNNIRNLCFIQDIDFSITNDIQQDKSYSVNKYENILQYIFKTDEYIISYIK